jgi:hypothetical protein
VSGHVHLVFILSFQVPAAHQARVESGGVHSLLMLGQILSYLGHICAGKQLKMNDVFLHVPLQFALTTEKRAAKIARHFLQHIGNDTARNCSTTLEELFGMWLFKSSKHLFFTQLVNKNF